MIAFTVGLAAVYEGIAIMSPLPTWSRVLQGIRDSGSFGRAVVGGIAITVGAVAAAFAGWVVKHLREDHRSSL